MAVGQHSFALRPPFGFLHRCQEHAQLAACRELVRILIGSRHSLSRDLKLWRWSRFVAAVQVLQAKLVTNAEMAFEQLGCEVRLGSDSDLMSAEADVRSHPISGRSPRRLGVRLRADCVAKLDQTSDRATLSR
jgi:hypothetical protein